MRRLVPAVLVVFLGLILSVPAFAAADTTKRPLPFPDVPRISLEIPKEMMEKGDVIFIVLDVRPDVQWKISPVKLPNAVHEDPMRIESWAHKYDKETPIVLY